MSYAAIKRLLTSVCLVCLTGCLLSPTAEATPSSEKSARGLFKRARAAMDRDDFESACPLLETALELHEGLGTRFNLAHCWESLGRTASAHAMFTKVAAIARATGQPDRQHVAENRAQQLEPLLSYVVFVLADDLEPSSVSVDGKTIAKSRWSRALPLDPGPHEILVMSDDRAAFHSRISLPVGPAKLRLAVPDAPSRRTSKAPVGGVAAEPRSTDDAVDSGSQAAWGWRTWAIVSGSALALSGTTFGLISTARASEAGDLADEQCPRERQEGCTRRQIDNYEQLFEERKRWNARARLGYGLGLASALSVAALLVLGEDQPTAAQSAAGFWPQVGRSEAGVSWSTQF